MSSPDKQFIHVDGPFQESTNLDADDVDHFINKFEAARLKNEAVDLAQYLPDMSNHHYFKVLCELIRVDLEIGWANGSPIALDVYLKRFPSIADHPKELRDIAYEEYRQRRQAGLAADRAEYSSRLGILTTDWPDFLKQPQPFDLMKSSNLSDDRKFDELLPELRNQVDAVEHPRVTLVPVRSPKSEGEVPTLLRRHLRLISLGSVGVLTYFSALVVLNPTGKAGLFLEQWPLTTLNWFLLLVCVILATLLWSRRTLSLGQLRFIESVLVGLFLAEMGIGLFSDLFLDHELRQPLAEGDHALFHYASSWSLPFFALIVGYGALVPSTGRRCASIVTVLALVPLTISFAGGIAEDAISRPFLVSYLLQMALWMIAAAAIAAYGAHRLEVLRREATEARRLGQYRLIEQLGSGGMGEVYLAEHILLRRPCAVKVVRPEMAGDPETLHRFEREARATAALSHPNTVQIFDYGIADDGTFYCAMEYLPGLNLEQLVLRNGPLQPERAVHFLRQVCGALGEAHRAGLIHRDIKPSNIIICERGGVSDIAKLLDFGLVLEARSAPGAHQIMPERLFGGTPSYTSPEQAEGRKVIDARTDIYSLGAVAYFILTGHPPFQRKSIQETLAAHVCDPVIPPRVLLNSLPAGLEQVVLRCLAKEPDRRFPDAQSMDRALASCVF